MKQICAENLYFNGVLKLINFISWMYLFQHNFKEILQPMWEYSGTAEWTNLFNSSDFMANKHFHMISLIVC